MTKRELKQAILSKSTELEGMLLGEDGEVRSFTDAEERAYTELEKEINSLESQLERVEKMEKRSTKFGNVHVNSGKASDAVFSPAEAVKRMYTNGNLDGFAAEVMQDRYRSIGTETKRGGMLILPDDFQGKVNARDYDSSKSTEIQPTHLHDQISIREDEGIIKKLGITVLDGLEGDFKIFRADSNDSATKAAENGVIGGDTKTAASKTLSPNRYGWTDIYTYENFAKMNDKLFAAISNNAGKSIDKKFEREIFTLAASEAPLALDKLGAKLIHKDFISAETAITGGGNFTYLTHKDVLGGFRGEETGTGGNARYLAQGGVLDAMTSSSLRILATTLTEAEDADKLILGDWSEMYMGKWWSGYEVLVNPYSDMTSGQVRMAIQKLADFAIRDPKAFALVDNIDMSA